MNWISVKDQLPEPKTLVLSISLREKVPLLTWFNGVCWTYKHSVIKDGYITHWMPLPEPPKEDV